MDNTQKIYDDYAKFGIPSENIPEYIGAETFARNIKRVSILKNVEVTYSSSTAPTENSARKS